MSNLDWGAIPKSLATDVSQVLNKKFGVSTGFKPVEWAEQVNIMGPLPIRTASGAIASFADGADDVPISSGTFSFLPTQSGTGTPSSSNPRPISGYTGMMIYHTGKNLLDDSKKYASDNNIYLGNDEVYSVQDYSSCFLKAGNYILTVTTKDATNTNFYLSYKGESTTFKTQYNSLSVKFTLEEDKNIVIRCYKSGYNGDASNIVTAQLEVGSTASTYQAYKAKTPIVDTFGRTVYGGSRNTDGTLTEECGVVTFDGSSDETWTMTDAQGVHRFYTVIEDAYCENNVRTQALACNMLSFASGGNPLDSYFFSGYNNQPRFFIVVDQSIDSTNALKTWLASHNLEVAYPLATPNTYTLDPIAINTYLGANNIVTDMETGECSIDYRADIDLMLTALQGSRSLSASLMRSTGPEEVSEPEENIQNTEEQEGENDAR